MKQVKLDRADARVKEFFRELPIEPDGVVLELNGKVVCKVVGPAHLTNGDQAATINRGRELVRRARERNRSVPSRVIEREVRQAVKEVRERKTR